MTGISVPIELNKHIPAPGLPRNISQPVDTECVSLEAREWVWNGRNVALVTIPGARTIKAQIEELKAMWTTNGLRAVRSDEFVQLYEHAADWPPDWIEVVAGGRIFFAGTVYKLKYPDETYQRIFATRYDHEVRDWIIECEDTFVTMTSGDRFACVLDNPDESVDSWMFKHSKSFPRRSLYRAEDRPLLVRHRRALM